MKSRAEHLQWCKDRALEYVEAGEPMTAFTSMMSDLTKHPDTAVSSALVALGMKLLLKGELDSPDAMRRFIEGFN